MNYYKNSEIADLLRVSNNAPARWIDYTLAGKSNLQLLEKSGRHYIINSPHNLAEMQRLKTQGRKYKSAKTYVQMQVSNNLYQVLQPHQLAELVSSLKIKKEIPLKFCAFNPQYIQRHREMVSKDREPDQDFYQQLFNYLEYQTRGYQVNLINLGPVEQLETLIRMLTQNDSLSKYLGLNISPSVLENNTGMLQHEHPKLKIKNQTWDVQERNFFQPLFEQKESREEISLVFWLEGWEIFSNFEQIMHNLKNSLDEKDILVLGNSLLPQVGQTHFRPLLENKEYLQSLLWLPQLLGIDTEACEIKTEYDEKDQARLMTLELNRDYELNLEINHTTRYINLEAGEQLIFWRQHLSTPQSLFRSLENAQLPLLQMLVDKDQTQIAAVCQG